MIIIFALFKYIVLLTLSISLMNVPVKASTKFINVVCYDLTKKEIVKEYKIHGVNYSTTIIGAEEMNDYTVIGNDKKKIIFGVDDEVEFYYKRKPKGDIDYKNHEKYVTGFPDGNFYPDRELTWAEAIKMIYNIKEVRKKDAVVYNNDIWYDEAFRYFQFYGYTSFDEDNIFFPSELIKKSEFTNLAVNFIDKYADKNVIDAFLQLDSLSDGMNISRGESAWIINKLLKRDNNIISSPTFKTLYKDVNEKHPLYNDIIEASISHDYIKDNKFERWLSIGELP